MVGILQRHRVIVIIISALLLIAAVWLVLSRQDKNRIPMRGVFVMEAHIQQYPDCHS